LSTESESVWSTLTPASAFKADNGTVDFASVMGGALEYATPLAKVMGIVFEGVVESTEALIAAAVLPLMSKRAMLLILRLFSCTGKAKAVRSNAIVALVALPCRSARPESFCFKADARTSLSWIASCAFWMNARSSWL
jgi:hypothetical protein